MPAGNFTMARQRHGSVPLAERLEAIFAALPDEQLIAALRRPYRTGRPSHNPAVLWRCYVAYYALNVESIAALARLLKDNLNVARACGVVPGREPSQPTLSRFGTRLASRFTAVLVRDVMRALTRILYDTLPDFGKSVAIDSTTIKAWSNPAKKGKNVRSKRRRAHPGRVSDPEAGWAVKQNTQGKQSYTFGYKVHILCDTTYELPIVVDITAGNVHDVTRATPLLGQARFAYSGFHPEYVLCDAGYSSDPLRRVIRRQYRAEPIIDPNPAHKKATERTVKTPEWKAIYKHRTSIERLNGRLKGFYRLNTLRVRGRMKVRIHATMAGIVSLATAIAFPATARCRVAA